MSVNSTRNNSPTVQFNHWTVVLDPKPSSHMAQSSVPTLGRNSPSSHHSSNFPYTTGPPSNPGTFTYHQSGTSWQHEQPARHTTHRPIEQLDRQYLRSNDDDELAYRRYNSDSYRNDHMYEASATGLSIVPVTAGATHDVVTTQCSRGLTSLDSIRSPLCDNARSTAPASVPGKYSMSERTDGRSQIGRMRSGPPLSN